MYILRVLNTGTSAVRHGFKPAIRNSDQVPSSKSIQSTGGIFGLGFALGSFLTMTIPFNAISKSFFTSSVDPDGSWSSSFSTSRTRVLSSSTLRWRCSSDGGCRAACRRRASFKSPLRRESVCVRGLDQGQTLQDTHFNFVIFFVTSSSSW